MGAARKRKGDRRPVVESASSTGPESGVVRELAIVRDEQAGPMADPTTTAAAEEPVESEPIVLRTPEAAADAAVVGYVEAQLPLSPPEGAPEPISLTPAASGKRKRSTRAAREEKRAEAPPLAADEPSQENSAAPVAGGAAAAEDLVVQPLVEPVLADAAGPNAAPVAFRDRLRYMHQELDEIHRERTVRRRRQALERVVKASQDVLNRFTPRQRVVGAIAIAAAMVFVILLITL